MDLGRESFFVLMAKGEMDKENIAYHGKEVIHLIFMYNRFEGGGLANRAGNFCIVYFLLIFEKIYINSISCIIAW